MRAYRSLTISYGLITVPVQIAPPFKEDRVSGNFICDKHHEKVSLKYECPSCGIGATRTTGYLVGDKYVVLDDAQKQALEAIANKVINIEGFTTEALIDPTWYDKSYVVWPKAEGAQGYALLNSLFKDGIAGCGTAVLEKSEVPVVIRYSPVLGRLAMHTCHFGAELRTQDLDSLGIIPDPDKDQVKAAKALIQSAIGPWDLTKHVDHYTQGMRTLLAGQPVAPKLDEAAPPADLIAALKASVEQQKNVKQIKSKSKTNGKVEA